MEELSRVMLAGVTERDSSLFAAYCSVEALNRADFIAGEAPPAAYLTEQRRRAELLGIAGPRVRQGSTSDGAQSSNPFVRNGRRPAYPVRSDRDRIRHGGGRGSKTPGLSRACAADRPAVFDPPEAGDAGGRSVLFT